MHDVLAIFQKRAEMMLHGQLDDLATWFVTPLTANFLGRPVPIDTREKMWEILSRQHLSQKSRGVVSVHGTLDDIVTLPDGTVQVCIHWRESTNPQLADASRSYRVTYTCRSIHDLHVTGFTLVETQAPPKDAPLMVFPKDGERW